MVTMKLLKYTVSTIAKQQRNAAREWPPVTILNVRNYEAKKKKI